MKYLFHALSVLALSLSALQAQPIINMPAGTNSLTTCNAQFFDSGGSSGNYGDNETRIYTFCPSTPGEAVRVTFSMLNIEENYDFFYIYNGNSTAAPLLGSLSGNYLPFFVVGDNATGCITFRFTSDVSVVSAGWAATVTCSRVVNMPTGTNTTTTCFADFFDGGGAFGSYSNNENRVHTFCPSSPGGQIRADFGSFNTEAGVDLLRIYNGSTTAAPLIGTYSGTNSPGLVTANNASGCLTFQFTSNASVVGNGWNALIECNLASGPANDACLGAISLNMGTSCNPVTGTIANATQSIPGCTGVANNDVWYSFVATSSSAQIIVNAPFDPVFEILSGNCSGLSSVVCVDAGGDGSSESIVQNNLIVGQTYYVRVYDYNSTIPAVSNFDICVRQFTQCAITAPANAILENEACGLNTNGGCSTTPNNFANTISCGQTVYGNIWANGGTRDLDYYALVVTQTTTLSATLHTGFPSVLLIATVAGGNCSNQVITQSYTTAACTPSTHSTTLTPGTYYLIVAPSVFDGYPCGGIANNYTLSVNLGTPVSLTATSNPATCASSTGTATATATGGTGSFGFFWSNGNVGATIGGLAAGTYQVTAVDANSCGAVTSVTVGASSGSLSASASSSPINCGFNGSATVAINGGTAPFNVFWNTGQTQTSITVTSAGTYNVTVTDANGCSATSSTTVSSSGGGLSLTASNTPVSCGTNGSATVAVSGGTAPYSFLWNTSQTQASISLSSGGTYAVTVTDATGCSATTSTFVNANNQGTFTINLSSTSAICTASNGSASSSVTNGGQAPFSYIWSNGQNTANLTGVSAGSYAVTVTDATGCSVSASTLISSSSGSLNASTSSANALCTRANGTATVSPSGGNSPFSYLWSNGANTASISNLSVGTYQVTVTDANGCQANASANVSATNISVTATSNTTASNCLIPTGSASVSPSNGLAPYTYLWDTGSTTAMLSNVGVGLYSVTITDANGCQGVLNNIVVNSANGPVVNLSATDANCQNPDGTATANVSGGLAPYSYFWSNGQLGSQAIGLIAGTYGLTVSDANSCETIVSITVNSDPGTLALNITTNNATCNSPDGSALANASGGTVVSNYNYLWSNGATTRAVVGLAPGTYTLTVSDDFGCSLSQTAIIGASAGTLSITETISPVTSIGGSNGAISLSASGGAAPYFYTWSNAASGANISNLSANTYTVTVTDANGCVLVRSFVVPENPSSIIPTGNSANWEVKLYPNPTQAQAFLELKQLETAKLEVRLYNSLGQILTTDIYANPASTLQHRLELGHLPPAMYWIELHSAENHQVLPLIKQ